MDIYLSNLLQTVIEFFFYNFMNSCFNFGDIILCNLLKTPQERDFLWHMVVILREISKEQITNKDINKTVEWEIARRLFLSLS